MASSVATFTPRRSKTPRQKPSALAKSHPATADMTPWKLEDAKARFSEVVRMASSNGPQLVTVRGKEAAVILNATDYRRLVNDPEEIPIATALRNLADSNIDLSSLLEREIDRGRDIDFFEDFVDSEK